MSEMVSTRRARDIAISFDPDRYGRDFSNTGTLLRKAAIRGAIIAQRDPIDGWQFNEQSLRQWLANAAAHRSGPRQKVAA